MALGNKKNDNLNFLILKIKTKDEEGKQVNPYFQITKRVEDQWVVQEDKPTSVSGTIYKVQQKVTEWKDEKIPRIDVYLKDGEDAYKIELKYTLLTRSILNSLISLEDASKVVELSLYTNKKGYSAVMVKAGDEILRWKFSLDELPKPNVVVFKGKEQRDFTPLDNFFEEEVVKWSNKLLGEAESKVAEVADDGGDDAGNGGNSSLF